MDINHTLCEYIKDNNYIESFDNIEDGVDIIYSLLLMFGIFITYFGNKYINKILLILGFFPGFYGVYYIASIIGSKIDTTCATVIIWSLLGGFLTSIISNTYINLAYTLLGFLTGSTIGYMLYLIFLNHIHIGTLSIYSNSFIVTELLSGTVGSIIFYKNKDNLLMISTSLIGPLFAIKNFDKLVFKTDPKFMLDIKHLKHDTLALVLYLIIYMVLSISGLLIQYRRYKKTKNPDDINRPIYEDGLRYN